jgi:hypothetical protein
MQQFGLSVLNLDIHQSLDLRPVDYRVPVVVLFLFIVIVWFLYAN